MARYTGPKLRIMRRHGVDLGLKSAQKLSATKRLNVPPGMHGQKGARKVSAYGVQLKEKQKARMMYGMLERQFRRFFTMASRIQGQTGLVFLQLLERRLDNTVYRLGFAATRAAARQMVSHGHVYVDEARVDIPSFLVKEGMVIRLSEKMAKSDKVKASIEAMAAELVPAWLERKGMIGNVKSLPSRDHAPSIINESLIVEYYSR